MKKRKNVYESIVALLVLIFVFFLSIMFSEHAVDGDQVKYIDSYEFMSKSSLLDAYRNYSVSLSRIDIIHFIVSYLGAWLGLDKSFYMSIFNVLLFYFGIRFLRYYGFSLYFSMLVLFCSFYIYALMFSLERLKFGFLFLFLFLTMRDSAPKWRWAVLALSVVSHVQMVVFYAVLYFEYWMSVVYGGLRRLRVKRGVIYLFPIIVVGLGLGGEGVLKKVLFYMEYYSDDTFKSFIKWLLFYCLVFLASKKKIRVSVRFLVLLVPVLLIGAERIVIFCFILFCMEYESRTRYYVILFFPVMMYFLYKSIVFLYKTYIYGHGY